MGVAWDNANQYWVFEGETSSIAKVDFREDHGPGFDDHSDGITVRYAVGEVSRMDGFPSHLLYDQNTQRLYIADTGNQRVGVLNTQEEGNGVTPLPSVEEGTQLLLMDNGPQIEDLVQDEGAFRGPTGLAMYEGVLYVSDTAKGRITAVDPISGEILDWLDTGISSPGLMGITFDQQGNLYAVDGLEDRVLRFSTQP
jgi:sugar lactone lactonase YvrE